MKLSNLIGVVFIIPGVSIVAACVRDLAHCNTWMLIVGCSMTTIGALIFDPSTVSDALKSLAGIAGPYVPTGGRRIGDPVDRPEEPKE